MIVHAKFKSKFGPPAGPRGLNAAFGRGGCKLLISVQGAERRVKGRWRKTLFNFPDLVELFKQVQIN